MKKAEVQLGGVYIAKIGQNVVPVRIDRESGRGWTGTNLASGREVTIKSAQKLRREATLADVERAKRARGNAIVHASVAADLARGRAVTQAAVVEAAKDPVPADSDQVEDEREELLDSDLSKGDLVDEILDLREKVAKLEAELSALRPRSLA